MKLIIDLPEDDYIAVRCEALYYIGHDKLAESVTTAFQTATPYEERPQGEWYYNYQNGWHCSICHTSVKDMPTVMGKANFAFCPNCGADMRGKEHEIDN